MAEVRFDLKTITPLFLSGAYSRFTTNDGLRPPSIRGLMRWWFRAIAGMQLGNDIKSLKKAESSVFGSTKEKSKIIIRSFPHNITSDRLKKAKGWNASKNEQKSYPHVEYFFYPTKGDEKSKGRKARGYLDPLPSSSDPDFTLLVQGGAREVNVASALIWAIFNLGGVGFRSRRGAGSLNIVKYHGDNEEQLSYIPSSPRHLSSFIKENLEKVTNTVSEYLEEIKMIPSPSRSLSSKQIPTYPVLSEKHSAIFVTNTTFSTWKDALREIGLWYLGEHDEKTGFTGGFRMALADFHLSDVIKQYPFPRKYTGSTEQRIFLGLPLLYAKQKAKVSIKIRRRTFERRGSPLLFGAYLIHDEYVPRIVLFNSLFLPGFSHKFDVERTRRPSFSMVVSLRENCSLNAVIKGAYEDLRQDTEWENVWGEIR